MIKLFAMNWADFNDFVEVDRISYEPGNEYINLVDGSHYRIGNCRLFLECDDVLREIDFVDFTHRKKPSEYEAIDSLVDFR